MENFIITISSFYIIYILYKYFSKLGKNIEDSKNNTENILNILSPYLAPVTGITMSDYLKKHINFWEKYNKKFWQSYTNNKKKEEKYNLVSTILFSYYGIIELANKLNVEVYKGKSLEKAKEEFDDKWKETIKRVDESEEKLKKLDRGIENKLRKRDLDYEFTREWAG